LDVTEKSFLFCLLSDELDDVRGGILLADDDASAATGGDGEDDDEDAGGERTSVM
jgi:hypothetical protein